MIVLSCHVSYCIISLLCCLGLSCIVAYVVSLCCVEFCCVLVW